MTEEEGPTKAKAKAKAPALARGVEVAGLVVLTAVSALLRLEGLGVSLWLDEGISIGIASHPLFDVPGLLAQDGSPPLYYLILHVWMNAFGDGAVAVRALSLLFALATVPVAFWAVRSLFGPRAGWMAAVLAATSPYLTTYGREARIYTLVVFLVLVCVVAFLHVFAFGRRRWMPAFTVSLALLMYTHNWGLFFAASCGLAVVPCLLARVDHRRVLLDAGIVFATVGVLYAPWLPTLLRLAHQTVTPWSQTPTLRDGLSAVGSVLSDERAVVALLVGAGAPLVRLGRQWGKAEGRAALALPAMCGATLAFAWVANQFESAWTFRYFGIFLAPLFVLAALGLSRAGGVGLVALVLIVSFWTQPLTRIMGSHESPESDEKGNVEQVARIVAPLTEPGDLVVSTHYEHVPLLHYYFGPELRYATPLGMVPDPLIVDWRDALYRIQASTAARHLEPLVERLAVGDPLFLVCPRTRTSPESLPWFRLMDLRCREWRANLDSNPDMALRRGPIPSLDQPEKGTSIFVMVYEKL